MTKSNYRSKLLLHCCAKPPLPGPSGIAANALLLDEYHRLFHWRPQQPTVIYSPCLRSLKMRVFLRGLQNAHFTSRRGHCRHINRENAHFTSRKRPFRQSKFENAHFTSRKGHLRHVNLAKMHFLPEGTVIFVMFTLQNALFTARNGGFRHVNLAKCTFYFKER